MRVLLLTQWFEPEPAFKGLGFAQALRDRGHEVEVLTGFPNYPGGHVYPGHKIRPIKRERLGGIVVNRVVLYPSHDSSRFGRVLNYVSFALSASIAGLFAIRRPDVIYVYHPPATVALPALLVKFFRGSKVVYDVQDLWPDTLAATGMMSNRRVLSVISAWCRWVYGCADRIVVLSNGFRTRLIERGVEDDKIVVLRNWSPDDGPASTRTSDIPEKGEVERTGLRVVYAGNMGRAQNLRSLLPAMEDPRVREAGVRLVFVGGGLEVELIAAEVRERGLTNVEVLPPVSKDEAAAMIRAADAALVQLRADPLFDITIPSKLQAYLRAGTPVLAGLRGDGQEIVEQAGAGYCFAPDDSASFADVLVKMAATSSDARLRMRQAARDYYANELSFERAIDATDELLGGLKEARA